jgi:transcriptional regulator with XRE-family HTH domain
MPIFRSLRAKRFGLTMQLGRKVSASEVADKVGISSRHYSNIESGRKPGSEELAILLGEYFECSPLDLLPPGWELPEGWDEAKKKPTTPPAQPQPKTTGPRKREQSDTKSPGRIQQVGAA